MRSMIATCALLSTLCLGADAPPPAQPEDLPEDVLDQSDPEWRADELKEKLARVQEQTAKIGERVARQAERAAALMQSKMALAQIGDQWEHADLEHGFDAKVGFAFSGSGRSMTQPLVVRTSEPDPASLSSTQEDLAVMARILMKALGKDANDSAMGIVLSAIPGSRRPQSVYLEGYGALFFLNVRYPLVPLPAKAEEAAEKQSDTTWEQTKRELYGPKPGFRTFNVAVPGEGSTEYDADQVAELKKDLVETLRNATNLRALKPDESVTIVVTGNRGGPGGRVRQVKTAPGNKGRKAEIMAYADADSGVSTATRESVLTLRAKKADVDAFANGTIQAAEFTKRVSLTVY